MEDSTNIILSFLENRPGYRRQGSDKLKDILVEKGYSVSSQDCAEALREFRKQNLVGETKEEVITASEDENENIEERVNEEGLELSAKWQSADGKWLRSYKKPSGKTIDPDKLKEIRDEVADHVDKRPYVKPDRVKGGNKEQEGVVTIADLHIGAYIKKMAMSPDFSVDKVVDYLDTIALEINSKSYDKVHILFLGDIIESFTGLNHINSWKQIQMHGSDVLITAYEILMNFLGKIENLYTLSIVSGNHDRSTSSNKEDEEGDISKIISYFLSQKLSGVDVSFSSTVLTKVFNNICYIITHGHLGLSKDPIEKIIWNYGKQGYYNVVLSGHEHSRKKSEPITTIKTLENDNCSYRAITCPSIFTGNFYSESNGWTTMPGFLVIENKNDKPKVEDIPL